MSRPQRWPSAAPAEIEHALEGGTANRGRVVRVGATVRRPMRPESASTHALLQHLAEVGFEGAPQLLGVDEQGREVLTFIEGETALPPYPAWALTNEAMESVALLLRAYHDATVEFPGFAGVWAVPVPDGYDGGGVVCHNDPNLDNVVFRDGRAVALIDFDLAAAGSRLWDVAAAVRLWAPLRAEVDVGDSRRDEMIERAGRFVDAYGLDGCDRAGLVAAVLANLDWCYAVVRTGAESGHEHFRQYWNAGGAGRASRGRVWTLRHATEISDAVR